MWWKYCIFPHKTQWSATNYFIQSLNFWSPTQLFFPSWNIGFIIPLVYITYLVLQFWRWIGHVTVRRFRFESLGVPSVKSPAKTSTLANRFFLKKILNMSSVISSVYTDRSIPSVYTDWITNEIVAIGNYRRNLPTELFHR
jgi:hypothetical protein